MAVYNNILVIQTAFTGDVVLGTSVLETLHAAFPMAKISYLVRKGNEGLLAEHPFLQEVLVWNKSEGKLKNLWKMAKIIRQRRYDLIVNLQRFASSGFMAGYSGAKDIRGFAKNPFSFLYHQKLPHSLEDGRHEIERNFDLIKDICGELKKTRLYPTLAQVEKVKREKPYICLAPASVWHTKQWPAEHWAQLIRLLADEVDIILTGGKADTDLCDEIIKQSGKKVENAAGKYNLLESTALVSKARVTVSNDSAPVHIASAMDAPVIEIYCSTVPQFGFSPLSSRMAIVETTEPLPCRPCGLHGRKACPLGHFRCATEIHPQRVAEVVKTFL